MRIPSVLKLVVIGCTFLPPYVGPINDQYQIFETNHNYVYAECIIAWETRVQLFGQLKLVSKSFIQIHVDIWSRKAYFDSDWMLVDRLKILLRSILLLGQLLP